LICKSLLKNGYTRFALEILEYCDRSKTVLREQCYLSLLKPEYNILKIAGSTFGFKHFEATKAKISAAWREKIKTVFNAKIKKNVSCVVAPLGKEKFSAVIKSVKKNQNRPEPN
jgi:group I intron endonuclease